MNQDPETSSRRRNGSQASCERCRKKKTKCDHKRPICSACWHRGLECVYHPAPMSKARTAPTSQGSRRIASRQSASRRPSKTPDSLRSAQPAPLRRSYKPYLSELDSADRHLPATRAVLHRLKHLDDVRDIMIKYFTPDRLSHVPQPFFFAILESLRHGAGAHRYDDEDYASVVLEASGRSVDMAPDLDMQGFCDLVTGNNLRIEVVGLVFPAPQRPFSTAAGAMSLKIARC